MSAATGTSTRLSSRPQPPAPHQATPVGSADPASRRDVRRRFAARIDTGRDALLWPVLLAVANSVAFVFVRPDVGDLQAALARQSGALHGVGLAYWFGWFGGGATPGNYSVVVPTLSALLGAVGVGALATVAITPLARLVALGGRGAPAAPHVAAAASPHVAAAPSPHVAVAPSPHVAAAPSPHVAAATWAATIAAALNLWSGRVPFALGCAVALVGALGVRRGQRWLAVGGIVAATLCSPVTGAFLAFVAAAAFLVDVPRRRVIFWACAACGVALLAIALIFGAPGPQGYPVQSALLAAAAALFLLIARPPAAVRAMLWCTAIAAPLIWLVPNGLGSNFSRLPWLCLPVVVVATASAPRRLVALALGPAIGCTIYASTHDLLLAAQPAASTAYYTPLIGELRQQPTLANYRVEVVQDPDIHTAAYALLGAAALAGGYETQEQHRVNAILATKLGPSGLNATSYKVWLDNNAVGFVAVNLAADTDFPEYQLVREHRPGYLQPVARTGDWALFRVAHATPIVPAPQRLATATQSQLTIAVPCACTFGVRVRYSRYLTATLSQPQGRPELDARVEDDGHGWTTVTTRRPGTYLLRGDLTGPLR